MSKELNNRLSEIQQKLKAPKGQENKFGKYKYRSCEDILEAVKPLLGDLTLTLSDDVIEVGGRVFVKATIKLSNGEDTIEVSAAAREAETQAGMAPAQCTGSSSSYARKYALNGMFAIDDTKDDDATNTHGKTENAKKVTKKPTATPVKPVEKPEPVQTRSSRTPAEKPAETAPRTRQRRGV